MSRLPPLPYRRVDRALRRLGFAPVRQKGSHVVYTHGDGRLVVVPRHPGEDVGPGLLRRIVAAAGVGVEEFLRHA